MIQSNIKKAVTDAIRAEGTVAKKWAEVGSVVRGEYETREAVEAIRAEFLDEVIYPAMGDDSLRVIRAELPRKGTKDWNAASSEQQAAWSQLNDAKKTVRGKGSVYFGRVVEYAFPSDTDKGPTQARDLKTRLNEELAALVKACQKTESASFDIGATIRALEATLAVVNK
jgi:hypothetical protein